MRKASSKSAFIFATNFLFGSGIGFQRVNTVLGFYWLLTEISVWVLAIVMRAKEKKNNV